MGGYDQENNKEIEGVIHHKKGRGVWAGGLSDADIVAERSAARKYHGARL
jgi:hypothetical protein